MGIFADLKKYLSPDDEPEDEFDDFTPRAPEKSPVTPRTAAAQRAVFTEERRDNKVVNIHATTQLQVVLVKPERYEDASDIADHLREKKTVVLNLEETEEKVARRLIDFLSGVAYAQDGKIKKVAVKTFLITPYNVDLVGDLLDELESTGIYYS